MLPVQKFVAGCLLQSCAIGLTLLSGGVHNAVAAETAACQPDYRSTLDARFANASDQGTQSLRQYVSRTRMIHEVDYQGAVARVERHRQAQAACREQLASSK